MTPDTNSYALLVRDAIYDRVKKMSFFRDFSFSKTKAIPTEADSIPHIGILFMGETMVPDGDANAGEVRFRTIARVGFSVIVQNNDDAQAEVKIDEAYRVLMGGLLNDPTLYHGDTVKIQAFSAASRRHSFGGEAETPIAQLEFDLSCDLGTITWPPVVTDDFLRLHIEAAPVLQYNDE